MKRRTLLRILGGIGIAILVLVLGFVIWASNAMGPGEIALSTLQGTEGVQVQQTDFGYAFTPASGTSASTAFIFYPGGKVDYRSYALPLEMIAAQGYPVYLVEMPLNLAVFGISKADEVIAAHPEIQHWAIGGHSLGGAMAASYVYSNPDKMDGLALWAAYPGNSNSLADRAIQVSSVYGELDGVAPADKVLASKPLLPPDTTWAMIPGGIHSYFGDYGMQPGDGQTEITPSSQWVQAADATVALLQKLGGQ